MLRVNKKPKTNDFEKIPNRDIIVSKVSYVTEYDKEGNRVIKKVVKKVNLTKSINETAKVLKTLSAEEKLASISQTLKG